jgi:hypothetical protein
MLLHTKQGKFFIVYKCVALLSCMLLWVVFVTIVKIFVQFDWFSLPHVYHAYFNVTIQVQVSEYREVFDKQPLMLSKH